MSLGRFVSVLKGAMFDSIHNQKNTKVIKNGTKRVWNPETARL